MHQIAWEACERCGLRLVRFDLSESRTSVQYDQIICMVLRSGSYESGVRRFEMKRYAYDAREMILDPRHVDQWFRTDDLHLLVVGISDAALTAACDGGQADLRYGSRLDISAVGQ